MKRLLVLLFACASAHAQLPPLPETSRSNIEYKSVADALTALRAKPGVEMTRIDTPRATPRKLGEMPPAKPFYTVVREIDGCPQNVSVPVARAHR